MSKSTKEESDGKSYEKYRLGEGGNEQCNADQDRNQCREEEDIIPKVVISQHRKAFVTLPLARIE